MGREYGVVMKTFAMRILHPFNSKQITFATMLNISSLNKSYIHTHIEREDVIQTKYIYSQLASHYVGGSIALMVFPN
jgi:hypothetical protein